MQKWLVCEVLCMCEKNGTLPTNGKNLGDLVEVNKKCPPQTP